MADLGPSSTPSVGLIPFPTPKSQGLLSLSASNFLPSQHLPLEGKSLSSKNIFLQKALGSPGWLVGVIMLKIPYKSIWEDVRPHVSYDIGQWLYNDVRYKQILSALQNQHSPVNQPVSIASMLHQNEGGIGKFGGQRGWISN